MPRSYRYYTCSDVPRLEVGESISTDEQLAFEWGDQPARSQIEYLGLAMRESFERYKVVHQIDVRMDVIWQQETVHKVLRRLEFPGYYQREEGYWVVGTGKREARTLFERLRKAPRPIIADAGTCDLGRVQRALQDRETGRTTGGHFSDLKIDRVRSASIFGTDTVVDSDEWTRYSEVGEVSAINVRMGVDDTSIMLTADRLVLVLSAREEHEDLRVVESINDLIDEATA